MIVDLLLTHFPTISEEQKAHFIALTNLYQDWNSKINVISRKDMDFFFEHHVLHSLGIAKILNFKKRAKVLDVGTGGGFPGIPLAILFPETDFFLIDSVGKKIKVVDEVILALGLKNVKAKQLRAEDFGEKVDFIVSRAVTKMDIFVPWIKNNIRSTHNHSIKNGILCLKGGDLTQELKSFPQAKRYPLNSVFNTSFFETKEVVYLPL